METNTEPRYLYRSRTNRIIAGVAGGLAAYFNVDASLIRLIFIILTFLGGAGFWLYIIAWILLPEEDHKTTPDEIARGVESKAKQFGRDLEHTIRNGNHKGQSLFAIILIVVGALFLLQNLIGAHVWSTLWPIILIVLGVALVFQRSHPS